MLRSKQVIVSLRQKLFLLLTISLFATGVFMFCMTRKSQSLHNHHFYITALFWNNEAILPNWSHQIIKLIDNHMDENKVFVSIVENSDSTDRTKELLLELRQKLDSRGIKNHFEFAKRSVREDRVKHLAILRNVALESLRYTNFPIERTKIIFLNDIYFEASDIVSLVETNQMQYDAACAMDFSPNFYDVWVSRDLRGQSLSSFYPYFVDEVARKQVRKSKPVRVYCCWNGVIVMKAAPFLPPNDITFRSRANDTDTYLSECTFLCKDFWKKEFTHWLVNPAVRVGYYQDSYFLAKYVFPYTWDIISDWFPDKPIQPPNYDSKDLSLVKLIPDSASNFQEETFAN